MGYYTYHTIDINCSDEERLEKIRQKMKEKEIIPYIFTEDFETQDVTKWYEEEEDMREISAMFPDIRFAIHGEGEDSGDIWDAYYLDGKRQYCPAIISIEPFDPEKLT